jgi:predicted nucleotide-binding protein
MLEAWVPIKQKMSNAQVEKVRAIPKILKDEGKSITWPAFEKYVDLPSRQYSFFIDQAIQHEYTKIYLQEHNATTISNIPLKLTNLCLPTDDLSYDYKGLRAALEPIGLWELIRSIDARDIVYLRSTLGWHEFISAFSNSCRIFPKIHLLKHFFAFIAHGPGGNLRHNLKTLQAIHQRVQCNEELSLEDVEFISNVLLEAAHVCAAHLGLNIDKEATLDRLTWLSLGVGIMRKIFVVHGHNHVVRDKIDIFLRDLGLDTVVMAAGAHAGRSLPEKFEEMAKCDFVVFLLTADDDLEYVKTKKKIKRARQNVVLEIGYFWGSMGRRGNVAFLVESDPVMELPSDIQGLGRIPITEDLGETKIMLRKEFEHAGII